MTKSNEMDWKRSIFWRKSGAGFCVEVNHYTVEPSEFLGSEGVNRWCVYAYIYPTHSHFNKFNGTNMWQEAALELPFHCGPSMLTWHMDISGKAKSVQVGADYHHDGDTHFTHYDNANDAHGVFFDAKKLFEWLNKKAS